MIKTNIKISFDKNKTALRIKSAADKAVDAVAQQVLQDCNYYCKKDVGTLIESSHINSEPDKNVLVWETPYARRQYYLDATNTGNNEHATKMWCEKAFAEHGDEWEKSMQKSFEQHLGGDD